VCVFVCLFVPREYCEVQALAQGNDIHVFFLCVETGNLKPK